jgi:hypothetical protein
VEPLSNVDVRPLYGLYFDVTLVWPSIWYHNFIPFLAINLGYNCRGSCSPLWSNLHLKLCTYIAFVPLFNFIWGYMWGSSYGLSDMKLLSKLYIALDPLWTRHTFMCWCYCFTCSSKL